jgi:hypothetical protein
MSETDPIREGKMRSPLPLSDDDYRVGSMAQDVNSVSLIEGLSYKKLFLTIVVAAPVAAVLAMISTDIYSAIAKKIGLRSETQIIVQPPVAAAKEDEHLKATIDGLVKANRNISAIVEKHTAALSRLASKEQASQAKDVAAVKTQKVETPPARETARQEPKDEKPTRPTGKGKLSASEARDRVEKLSGVDIGEPVQSFKPFETIKSKEKLQEIADALDDAISGAKAGGTLKKNAEKAKKIVNSRLASIEKK